MSRTAMSAWYIEMWVNAPLPVTSPTAQHARRVHRACRVVDRTSARGPAPVQADRVNAERGEVGPAAGCHQQPLGGQLPAVGEREREPLPVVPDTGRRGAQ